MMYCDGLVAQTTEGRRSAGKISNSLPRNLLAARAVPPLPSLLLVKTPGPPRIVAWWESLETWVQLAISFPVLAIFTFLLNVGPFNQALLRSVFYGLFEGAVLSGLLAVATRAERDRRGT